MKLKIIAFIALAVAAFLTRTVWFDLFRSSQITVEITGDVPLVELPYPVGKSGNRVLDTVRVGDQVKVTKTFIADGYVALKVRTAGKKAGYIIKGKNIVVR